MKINELLNEGQQLDEIFGWLKGTGDQMTNRYLPGFMRKWKEYMTLAPQTGNSPNNPEYRVKVLKQMLARYVRPVGEEIDVLNKLIADAGQNIANDNTIKQIATRGIAIALQRRIVPPEKEAAKKKVKAKTSPTKTAPPAIGTAPMAPKVTYSIAVGTPIKVTDATGDVEYVWNGSEWRNGRTGKTASKKIANYLTQAAPKVKKI
jgi:hypothetical protein